MKFGVQVFFQHRHPEAMSAREMFKNELGLCRRAEELRFDYLLSPEHHFTDYSVAPDPLQMLSYIAGVTERIGLVTGAIILPWWLSPVRVAEKISLLDHLCDGRLIVGFGRGLSPREYGLFNLDMSEARPRFDEAAPMILRALETGVMEGDGPFFKQQPTPIKPAAQGSFQDRVISIGRSEDSILVAAELRAALAIAVDKPIEELAPNIELHRNRYRELHGEEAPPPWLIDFTYVDEDPVAARELAEHHMSDYYHTILEHYDAAGHGFDKAKGYEGYAARAAATREAGIDSVTKKFLAANTYGTPDEVIEQIRHRRDVIGDYVCVSGVSFGGLPYDKANQSLTLFGEKVAPALADGR